jgi:hypothetical protein
MPFENEHSCRVKPPKNFEKIRRVNNAQKSDGKSIDVLYGIKNGKSEIQALRYKKSIWTAKAARTHCNARGGSFEAAGIEAQKIEAQKTINGIFSGVLYCENVDQAILKEELKQYLPENFKGSVYCAGAVGFWYPGLINPETKEVEPIKVFFPKKAVGQLAAQLNGKPVYIEHDLTDKPRKKVAIIDEGFKHKNAAYFMTLQKIQGEYPACSAEINVMLHGDIVKEVIDLKAMALLKSKPACEEAKLIFEKTETETNTEKEKETIQMPEENIQDKLKETDISFKELRRLVNKYNIHPSQLFDQKDIMADREFKDIFGFKEEHLKETTKLQKDLTTAMENLKIFQDEKTLNEKRKAYEDFLQKKFEDKTITSIQHDFLNLKQIGLDTEVEDFYKQGLMEFDLHKKIFVQEEPMEAPAEEAKDVPINPFATIEKNLDEVLNTE